MTKEQVLQKVNDYCTEKQYTTATLTDSFKDKFATHFQKANAEGDINDEATLANLRFALNTAFSSASELATVKTTEFSTKENDLKNQIEELKKQVKEPPKPKDLKLPKEVEEQLKELQRFKDEKTQQDKRASILSLAKNGIRQDLHASFDKFAADYNVKTDVDDNEQAKGLVAKFQDIFKDSIGDIKPKAPVQTQKQEEDFIASIGKVKVQ